MKFKSIFILVTVTVIMTIQGCETDPANLLIGSWQDRNSDIYIAFHSDGRYDWHIPDPGLDPNAGGGNYEIHQDTLIIIETGWFGTDTSYYNYLIERKYLELTNLISHKTNYYDRKRK